MSTTPTAGSLPTRQQLDEIDALLRRMLSLPAAGGPTIRDTTPSTPPPTPQTEPVVQSWRVEWPRDAAAPPSVVAWGTPVTVMPPTGAPVANAVHMAYPSHAAPYAIPMHDHSGRPIQVVYPQPTPMTPNFVEQPPPSTMTAPTLARFLPLAILNSGFDALSYLFGPLGTWMRGAGRPVLGWLGLILIAISAAWAFGEWSGFDWPKPEWAKKLGLDRLR